MLFNIELLTHIGQSVIGELLTIVGEKNFRCTMFKYKFLENGVSYSGSLLIRYGLCNGPSGEMVNHHQYGFVVIIGGRQLHNRVSRYLSKSSPWYLSHLQLRLVSLHLLPLTHGATVYMGLNVFYHFRPVVVSFDQGIGFPIPKWPKWLCISWRTVLIRVFGTTVALYSLPFSLFMWYNNPVLLYPYESLSWNLLLGSSTNLAILMQCLSDCSTRLGLQRKCEKMYDGTGVL